MILLMATTKRTILHKQIVKELELPFESEDPPSYQGLTGTPAAVAFGKEKDYDCLKCLHVVEAEDGELLEGFC